MGPRGLARQTTGHAGHSRASSLLTLLPLQARIALLLPPQHFAALCTTARVWRDLAVGPTSLWRDFADVYRGWPWPAVQAPSLPASAQAPADGADGASWAHLHDFLRLRAAFGFVPASSMVRRARSIEPAFPFAAYSRESCTLRRPPAS